MTCEHLIQMVGNDQQAQRELAELVASYMQHVRDQNTKVLLYDLLEIIVSGS